MYAPDHAVIATPVGGVRVEASKDELIAISIAQGLAPVAAMTPLLKLAEQQLMEWFAGTRTSFDLPLRPTATPRGEALRAAIASIGYGATMSYGALARATGSGARAIGQACARNPFPIVIPCHRVLAAGGALGAYSGGDGPVTKQWLLDHEQRHRLG
ncbi:methylated-DNA--[protein]-cysteine S-methyltransferase [Sphingomonas sp. GlSt437]|uniref:methylated-DNA--[protein]-cysteine S-methyltransferase n=1 Tax=Sphingomonas sp. GlSt437 TaxID=3389970 RepID=UPI003A838235